MSEAVEASDSDEYAAACKDTVESTSDTAVSDTLSDTSTDTVLATEAASVLEEESCASLARLSIAELGSDPEDSALSPEDPVSNEFTASVAFELLLLAMVAESDPVLVSSEATRAWTSDTTRLSPEESASVTEDPNPVTALPWESPADKLSAAAAVPASEIEPISAARADSDVAARLAAVESADSVTELVSETPLDITATASRTSALADTSVTGPPKVTTELWSRDRLDVLSSEDTSAPIVPAFVSLEEDDSAKVTLACTVALLASEPARTSE